MMVFKYLKKYWNTLNWNTFKNSNFVALIEIYIKGSSLWVLDTKIHFQIHCYSPEILNQLLSPIAKEDYSTFLYLLHKCARNLSSLIFLILVWVWHPKVDQGWGIFEVVSFLSEVLYTGFKSEASLERVRFLGVVSQSDQGWGIAWGCKVWMWNPKIDQGWGIPWECKVCLWVRYPTRKRFVRECGISFCRNSFDIVEVLKRSLGTRCRSLVLWLNQYKFQRVDLSFLILLHSCKLYCFAHISYDIWWLCYYLAYMNVDVIC